MTDITLVNTNNAPQPLGHYSQAVKGGGLIHISGQLPIKVDAQGIYEAAPFAEQVDQVLGNLLAILNAAGASPDNVLKVTAYIVGVDQWGVFNAAFSRAFGSAKPARSVVPVPELHHGFLIELDAVAIDPSNHIYK